MKPSEAQIHAVDDVSDYLRYVKEIGSEPGGEWIFRGHRDASWELSPQIDRAGFVRWRDNRSPQQWDRLEHEKWLLKEFAKKARPFTGAMAQYGWDLIAVGQHHGLATRLLDWTTNPLTALFFAIEERSRNTSCVWIYKHAGASSAMFSGPLLVPDIVTFDPPHVSPRIAVQSARFTVHPKQGSHLIEWPGLLFRLDFPERARPLLRLQLRNLGVNRSVFFPDLDGIALDLNRGHGHQDDEGNHSPDSLKASTKLIQGIVSPKGDSSGTQGP